MEKEQNALQSLIFLAILIYYTVCLIKPTVYFIKKVNRWILLLHLFCAIIIFTFFGMHFQNTVSSSDALLATIIALVLSYLPFIKKNRTDQNDLSKDKNKAPDNSEGSKSANKEISINQIIDDMKKEEEKNETPQPTSANNEIVTNIIFFGTPVLLWAFGIHWILNIIITIFVWSLLAPSEKVKKRIRSIGEPKYGESIWKDLTGIDFEIEYIDSNKEKSERKVTIKEITLKYGDTIYVHGFCHLRKNKRTFKFSNITAIYKDNKEMSKKEFLSYLKINL